MIYSYDLVHVTINNSNYIYTNVAPNKRRNKPVTFLESILLSPLSLGWVLRSQPVPSGSFRIAYSSR